MKRLSILLMLVMLLTGILTTSAYAQGYEVTTTAPEAGMLPLNYTFTKTVYDASGGTLVARAVPMTITAYVRWITPQRPAEYYVTENGQPIWFILNRETIDGG